MPRPLASVRSGGPAGIRAQRNPAVADASGKVASARGSEKKDHAIQVGSAAAERIAQEAELAEFTARAEAISRRLQKIEATSPVEEKVLGGGPHEALEDLGAAIVCKEVVVKQFPSGREVRIALPASSCMMDLKAALVRKIGQGKMSQVRLVRGVSATGSLELHRDWEPISSVVHALLLGGLGLGSLPGDFSSELPPHVEPDADTIGKLPERAEPLTKSLRDDSVPAVALVAEPDFPEPAAEPPVAEQSSVRASEAPATELRVAAVEPLAAAALVADTVAVADDPPASGTPRARPPAARARPLATRASDAEPLAIGDEPPPEKALPLEPPSARAEPWVASAPHAESPVNADDETAGSRVFPVEASSVWATPLTPSAPGTDRSAVGDDPRASGAHSAEPLAAGAQTSVGGAPDIEPSALGDESGACRILVESSAVGAHTLVTTPFAVEPRVAEDQPQTADAEPPAVAALITELRASRSELRAARAAAARLTETELSAAALARARGSSTFDAQPSTARARPSAGSATSAKEEGLASEAVGATPRRAPPVSADEAAPPAPAEPPSAVALQPAAVEEPPVALLHPPVVEEPLVAEPALVATEALASAAASLGAQEDAPAVEDAEAALESSPAAEKVELIVRVAPRKPRKSSAENFNVYLSVWVSSVATLGQAKEAIFRKLSLTKDEAQRLVLCQRRTEGGALELLDLNKPVSDVRVVYLKRAARAKPALGRTVAEVEPLPCTIPAAVADGALVVELAPEPASPGPCEQPPVETGQLSVEPVVGTPVSAAAAEAVEEAGQLGVDLVGRTPAAASGAEAEAEVASQPPRVSGHQMEAGMDALASTCGTSSWLVLPPPSLPAQAQFLTRECVATNGTLLPYRRKVTLCDSCGKVAPRGLVGMADFSHLWYCVPCWKLWGRRRRSMLPEEFSKEEMQRMLQSARASRRKRLCFDDGGVGLDLTAVATSQVSAVVRRVSEPCMDYDIIPMGHSCTTARFLRHQTHWRDGPDAALPLDWSVATFRVWEHMLRDDFELLLRQRERDGQVHPYNWMFAPDVDMFKHVGGWAVLPTQRRRVERLRQVLAAGRAFGLAFYFDGVRPSGCPPLHVVMADAASLVAEQERSFQHIVVVWLEKKQFQAPAKWIEPSDRLSVLRFSYTSPEFTFGEYLEPEDVVRVAHHLEARFPHVFRSNLKGEQRA